MSNYPIGAENDPNAPYNEVDEKHTCMFCGEKTDNLHYCSKQCEVADFND